MTTTKAIPIWTAENEKERVKYKVKSKAFIPSEDRFVIIDGIEKCDKCGKSELVYDGCKCDIKWNTLKNVLLIMSSRTELISDKDTYYTCDQQWGFDEALSRIENIIEKLEEK